MPRPKPLVALHGQVDFSKLAPFDAAIPLSVNDFLVMRREAGGPNVIARVGDVQAHTGGAVDISALTGGIDDDMLFRLAGVWTGSGGTGLSYNGSLLAIPVGTASDPTLVGVGSLTTGIFYPGAGIWGVSVLGVERIRAKSTGIDITGNLFLLGTRRPGLRNIANAAGVPTVVPDNSDLDTGHGTEGNTNGLSTIVGGVRAVAWRATGAGDGSIEYTADLTTSAASTTQTQGQATQNSAEWSRITTVSNPDDVITLGGAAAGRKTQVCNQGANRLQIFPNAGDDLGLGVNIPMFLEVGESTTFFGLTAALWQRVAGKGSTLSSVTFPELVFNAGDFENPNNADWDVNALAPAVADSNNNALTIRAFDDTVIEGVGGYIPLPAGATNFVFSFVGRAETAPGAARNVRMSLRVREVPDNAAVAAPPWITGDLANFDIPTNEFFQFDSETFSFAFFGFAAGELIQFELVRVSTIVGTDLTGDYDLLQMRVGFT